MLDDLHKQLSLYQQNLELLDALNEKKPFSEKRKLIKDTEIVTAKHLAVSYKPREVTLEVEKSEIG
jgi:hypothetical protein